MKCPGCGYQSFDLLETCKRCGAPMLAAAGRGAPARAPVSAELEVGEHDLERELARGARTGDDGEPFRIDDDLFLAKDPPELPVPAAPAPPPPSAVPEGAGGWLPGGSALAEPTFVFTGEAPGEGERAEPIIDRYDEVPERCWAPEVAGLGRRAFALLIDQAILAAVLAGFFFAASLGLRLAGADAGLLLGAAGLQASATPFALLAALLSLAYHGYFHGSTGRTPGKALLGLQVRTGEGGALSYGRAAARWLGGAAGALCCGAGLLWALFEPRRRGWADLLSGTVVALPPRESAAGIPRR